MKLEFKNVNTKWLILAGVIALMYFMPGTGFKAANQQSLIMSEVGCGSDLECPKCIGGGFEDYNPLNVTMLGELSYAKCKITAPAVRGTCELSDMCTYWDCPTGATNCESVKKTLLENTVEKFNKNPAILILVVGLVVAYFML